MLNENASANLNMFRTCFSELPLYLEFRIGILHFWALCFCINTFHHLFASICELCYILTYIHEGIRLIQFHQGVMCIFLQISFI